MKSKLDKIDKHKKPFEVGSLVCIPGSSLKESIRFGGRKGLFLVLEMEWDDHFQDWWVFLYSQQRAEIWDTWALNFQSTGKKNEHRL